MDAFRKLKVWEKAHSLVLRIYDITKKFPKEEQFRLTDQLCRSASSIPANIAEGQSRRTTKEYLQFLYTARGSVSETKYHLLLARDLNYLENSNYENLNNEYDEVIKMLNGLIKSLRSNDI